MHKPLHIHFDQDQFGSLDPASSMETSTAGILYNLFEGLYRWEKQALRMAAAEHVQISDNRLTYTFLLAEKTWSDLTPVTARDFVYAWERARASEDFSSLFDVINSFFCPGLEGGRTADALDGSLGSRTLVVNLHEPCAYLEELLSSTAFLPLPSSDEAIGFNTNGTYRVETVNQDRRTIVLRRNHSRLDSVVLTCSEDRTTLDAGLAGDSWDLADAVPYHNAAVYENAGLTSSRAQIGTFFLAFNARRPVDPATRAIVAAAINPESVECLGTMTNTHSENLVPWPLFNELVDARRPVPVPSPQMSKSRELVFVCNDQEYYIAMARQIAQSIHRHGGPQVTVLPVHHTDILDVLRSDAYDLAQFGWIADFADPTAMLKMFESNSTMNFFGYTDQRFDGLMRMSDREFNKSTRHQLLRTAELLLLDEHVVIPIYHYTLPLLRQPWIVWLETTPVGAIDYARVTRKNHG